MSPTKSQICRMSCCVLTFTLPSSVWQTWRPAGRSFATLRTMSPSQDCNRCGVFIEEKRTRKSSIYITLPGWIRQATFNLHTWRVQRTNQRRFPPPPDDRRKDSPSHPPATGEPGTDKEHYAHQPNATWLTGRPLSSETHCSACQPRNLSKRAKTISWISAVQDEAARLHHTLTSRWLPERNVSYRKFTKCDRSLGACAKFLDPRLWGLWKPHQNKVPIKMSPI